MTFVNSATTTAAAVELHHLLGLYLGIAPSGGNDSDPHPGAIV
jgi:hypothetical protein